MKRHDVLIVFFLFCIINKGYNQTGSAGNCDLLKKENSRLKNELNVLRNDTSYLRQKIDTYSLFYDTKTYSINKLDNFYRLEIISCKGDTNSHIVKIRFAVTHNKSAQNICLFADSVLSYAIDDLGNRFGAKECSIGLDKGDMPCTEIPAGVLTKGYIIYKNVISGCDNLNYVKIHISYGDSGGSKISLSDIVIRNIKIKW
jgi:hypothetical protein